jgi:hypothetical protein
MITETAAIDRAVWTPDAILAALGEGFAIEVHENNRDHMQVVRQGWPHGAQLTIRLNPYGYKGRATVNAGGLSGQGRTWHPNLGTMSTALDRGPEALAKAVHSRLLPKALPKWQEADQRRTELGAENAARWAAMDQLGALWGVDVRSRWPVHETEVPVCHAHTTSGAYVSFTDRRLNIEGMTNAQAVAVSEAVAKILKG